MNKLLRVFKPEPEDTLKLLKMVVDGYNSAIGKCTTCVHHVPSEMPGFVTDYGYCKKNCECFASKVCGLEDIDCNEYEQRSIDKTLEEIKELEREIEERERK